MAAFNFDVLPRSVALLKTLFVFHILLIISVHIIVTYFIALRLNDINVHNHDIEELFEWKRIQVHPGWRYQFWNV